MATWLAAPAALAQTRATAPPRSDARPEVVILGTREANTVLAAQVEPADMMQVVRLARRVAGKRRVINEIEVVTGSTDHD